MSNPFEAHADLFARPMRGSRERAAEKAAQIKGERLADASPLEKARAEKQVLTRRWKQARREEWKRAAGGDFGPELVAFRKALKHFDETQSAEFLDFVLRQDWLRGLPKTSRAVARGLVTQAVIRIRARAGFEFIDDSLPGEPPTVLERAHAFIGRE